VTAPAPAFVTAESSAGVPAVAAERRVPHWLLAAVAGLMLVSAGLAAVRLGWRSMWFDESFSLFLARADWSQFWETVWRSELNMVAYYLVLRGWTVLFGTTEIALRALSTLFAVATVPVVALVGRRLFGNRAALIAATLFATHGSVVRYAQEVRAYTMATFLVALAALSLVVAVQETVAENSRRARTAWFGFALGSVLAVYAHFVAALAIASLAISVFALPWRLLRWRNLAPALGLLGALLLPLAVFLPRAPSDRIEWVGEQSAGAFARSVFFVTGDASMLLRNTVLGIAVVLALSFARRLRLRGRGVETWSLVLPFTWAVVPLLLALLISLVQPLLVPRYLIVSVPGVCLGIAAALRLVWGRWTLAALTILVVVMQSIAFPRIYTEPQPEAWQALAETVVERADPDDGLVVVPGWQRPTLEYYLAVHPGTRRSPADLVAPVSPPDAWGAQEFYGGDPRLVTDEDAEAFPTLWVVADGGDPIMPERADQNAAVEERWRLSLEMEFGDLTLRRYERRS